MKPGKALAPKKTVGGVKKVSSAAKKMKCLYQDNQDDCEKDFAYFDKYYGHVSIFDDEDLSDYMQNYQVSPSPLVTADIDVKTLEDKVEKMEKDVKDLQKTVVAMSEKVHDLKKQIDVHELEGEVDAMTMEIEDLQKTVVASSEKIKDLKEQVLAKMAEIYPPKP